ncbi:MAG TPA: hypothetical protein PK095_07915 [Myxococcota bacterium]|nr:hypothetical protein [Myxococcota bacterium]
MRRAHHHIPKILLALLAVLTALPLTACADEDTPETTPILIVAPTTAVPGPEQLAADDPDLLRALDDAITILEVSLERMTQTPVVVIRAPVDSDLDAITKDRRPHVLIVLDAHRFEDLPSTFTDRITLDPNDALDPDEPHHDDRFVLQTARRARYSATLGERPDLDVALSSRTRLGRQYAIYELLRRVGARYYHPEDDYLPVVALDSLRARLETPTVLGAGPIFAPAFVHRSYTFHGAHPLEQLESFSDSRHPITEAKNVNDWIIKNRGDIMRGAGRGIAPTENRDERVAQLEALRTRRGLRRTVGITLHNQQQGASADLDPTSPIPLEEQARALVIERLDAVKDAYAFGIHFGPTELTTTPDRETVALINAAGQKALELRPELTVEINVHTTGTQPVDHYDDLGCPPGTNDRGVADYYDLAFHTDERFAARVHTVMFHPLEGPAGVYNQPSFAHKLCLMTQASAAGRPLIYFPESAYWLSWDNTIPVYLPLYLHSRWRDIQLIRPLLLDKGGTVRDHRLFNSGHEWGYWQADYAVGLLHWEPDLTLRQVVGELADPFCAVIDFNPDNPEPITCQARTTFIEVLLEVMEDQRLHFLEAPDSRGKPGGLYTMFAGEDPADELGAVSGLEFRPVRIPFRALLDMSFSELEAFVRTDLDRLAQQANAYEGWRDRLLAVRAEVPEAGLRFFDETVDGLAINAVRARHTHALYLVAMTLRDHPADEPEVTTPLAKAQAHLAEAETIIARREAAYRYPAAQTHGGGLTPDTATPNGTTYPYRVHTKTHLLSYWTNRQAQIEDLVAGRSTDPTRLALTPVFAPKNTPATLTWPAIDGLSGTLTVSASNDTLSVDPSSTSLTVGEGLYEVTGLLETSAAPLPVSGAIVRGGLQVRMSPGAFHLDEPDSSIARTVLASLVPLIRLGLDLDPDDGSARLALLVEPGGADTANFSEVVVSDLTVTDGALMSRAFDLALPIPDPSTGKVALSVGLTQTTLSGPLATFEDGGDLLLTGRLSVDDLVDALVELAGFEPVGAIETLSGILGFDPMSPPADVPFKATLTVTADPASP